MNWLNFAIHCSDSLYGTASEIREWHLARGWKDIGYQVVILSGVLTQEDHVQKRKSDLFDGTIEVGRRFDLDPVAEWQEIGAHIKGWNSNSFGVCLVGRGRYTIRQLISLKRLYEDFKVWANPDPRVIGHYEADPVKTCPMMDMDKVRLFLTGDGESFHHIEDYIEAL